MFPASTSNQISYEYFCILGGIANPVACRVMRVNGTHIYFTYHHIGFR